MAMKKLRKSMDASSESSNKRISELRQALVDSDHSRTKLESDLEQALNCLEEEVVKQEEAQVAEVGSEKKLLGREYMTLEFEEVTHEEMNRYRDELISEANELHQTLADR